MSYHLLPNDLKEQIIQLKQQQPLITQIKVAKIFHISKQTIGRLFKHSSLWDRPSLAHKCIKCGKLYHFRTHRNRYYDHSKYCSTKCARPVSTCHCIKCGFTWTPKSVTMPQQCARCKTNYWNKPKYSIFDDAFDAHYEPQLGDVRRNCAIGNNHNPYHKFIYVECPSCKIKHWVRLIIKTNKPTNTYCLKCSLTTPEYRYNRSVAVMGKNNPFYGKKHSPTSLVKMRTPRSEEFHITTSKVRKLYWVNITHEQRIILMQRFHTPEVHKKMSIAKQGVFDGCKNPNWQGGLSFIEYDEYFNDRQREWIRFRDNYTCQICRKMETNRHFDVHHIDFNKRNSNPVNLITLCHHCHGRTFPKHRHLYWISILSILMDYKLKEGCKNAKHRR